jgi:ATP-dependent DNA helicase DinG
MLIKLKQGCGRLIRTETDTGVIALLDCRAGLRGAYRGCVLNGLSDYRVTDEFGDIEPFLLEKKEPEYWLNPRKG